jgi:ribose transport system ATP-binding protein
VAVIFVSHDIDEVFRIADRITALRDGRVIGTVKLGEVTRPEVVGMIVGNAARAIKDVEREAARASVPSHGRKTTMALRDYRATDDSEPISFEVRSGEVLGLTGLAGSAARDLPYLMYGAAPWVEAPTGWIELTHSRIALNRMAPWRALREGLVLVPGARLREGGVASLTVFENVSLVLLRRYFAGGRIKFRAMRSHVRSLLDRFNVTPADPTMHFGNLSGGNQQKVVVAKWLEGSPSIVLLVDPTQGVDVGARAEIWATVVELAESGCSVVCASSDSEELATICHRLLVLRQEGGVFAEVTGQELEKDRITELC